MRRTLLPPAAVESLRRWFRLYHVYHNNAIEGNRLTLQETQAVVELQERHVRELHAIVLP